MKLAGCRRGWSDKWNICIAKDYQISNRTQKNKTDIVTRTYNIILSVSWLSRQFILMHAVTMSIHYAFTVQTNERTLWEFFLLEATRRGGIN